MEVVVPGGAAVVEDGGGSDSCCGLLHCSAMAVERGNRQQREEDNGESREGGRARPRFFPIWRSDVASMRRAREARGSEGLRTVGHDEHTSTPAVQLLKELLILPRNYN
jgi:hypothetical protein